MLQPFHRSRLIPVGFAALGWLAAACSSCAGALSAGGSGSSGSGGEPDIGGVYEVPGGTALATPPPNGCRTGRIGGGSEEDRRCEGDEDCVLTNYDGPCSSCFCPFAYYAVGSAWLAGQLDPSNPIPSCPAIECDRSCSQCGSYDAEHRPTRAVCRSGRCRPDPPPPGTDPSDDGWY